MSKGTKSSRIDAKEILARLKHAKDMCHKDNNNTVLNITSEALFNSALTGICKKEGMFVFDRSSNTSVWTYDRDLNMDVARDILGKYSAMSNKYKKKSMKKKAIEKAEEIRKNIPPDLSKEKAGSASFTTDEETQIQQINMFDQAEVKKNKELVDSLPEKFNRIIHAMGELFEQKNISVDTSENLKDISGDVLNIKGSLFDLNAIVKNLLIQQTMMDSKISGIYAKMFKGDVSDVNVDGEC